MDKYCYLERPELSVKQLTLPDQMLRFGIDEAETLILFGPIPSERTLEYLLKQNVALIWNLMAECSGVADLEKNFFIVINSKIEDFSIPNRNEFLHDLDLVCEHLKEGKNIYIHCLGGHGRTGMALAALGMRLANMTAAEALNFSQRNCHGPETEIQKDFILNLIRV